MQLKDKGAFRVLIDTFVTSFVKAGTGIVHLAPYFGEEDYRVCLKAGLIVREEVSVYPLDDAGRFTDSVTDFRGQHVKEADGKIIKMLIDYAHLPRCPFLAYPGGANEATISRQ